MTVLQLVYGANILVAGSIGIRSLFFPESAAHTVFQGAYPVSEVMRLVGCLWLAIAVLSGCGLWQPIPFAAVLVLQLIYKGSWLLVVALPAAAARQPLPKGMTLFFIV